MYAREIDGQELNFGVSGKLIMNNLVMYDRETDSLWSQFFGEAVAGRLAGTKLPLVASQILQWGDWKAQHPDTLFLDTGLDGLIIDGYMSYYFSDQTGIVAETNTDDRLRPKDLVVGILGESTQKAYSYRDLVAASVVNDTFDSRDLVVTMDVRVFLATVFERTLDDATLTFGGTVDSGQMTDRETGSIWDKQTGVAVAGELEGKRLIRFPFITGFWFGWKDFHPDTQVYEPEIGP